MRWEGRGDREAGRPCHQGEGWRVLLTAILQSGCHMESENVGWGRGHQPPLAPVLDGGQRKGEVAQPGTLPLVAGTMDTGLTALRFASQADVLCSNLRRGNGGVEGIGALPRSHSC